MKNNPNIKYLLIGLVVFIWGLIIYKVIKGLSGDDAPPPVTKIKPPVIEDTLTGYALTTAAYPDPFSNDIFEEEDTIEEKVANGAVINEGQQAANGAPGPAPLPQPVMEPPPAIKYSGYIYNPKTRRKTAMISFNGRIMTVGVNEKIDDKTKVTDISDQQLTIRFNGKKVVYVLGG
ncbi:hypothetical protein A8C56_02785 [Niabella ginsenosidivorans]|uniref:Type II secretion system protein GspC N-terminal domain-containing protein n=1 Tax=Niabella ginsenosidivorans TaxID=1176587 RepID=A0A1A9HZ23_9BACT|nr:hypothetical protein [Niabella ginsenosidivorans]ANH80049.1 hypothetical protein A8C56_02785 [Niabella ginsenosidivorans]